jgi:hypothetical protein
LIVRRRGNRSRIVIGDTPAAKGSGVLIKHGLKRAVEANARVVVEVRDNFVCHVL